MKIIDETVALQVLKNEMEASFSVAISRGENLWETKRAIQDKLFFLEIIGVITKEEWKEEDEKIEEYYRKKKRELQSIEDGFDDRVAV